MPDYVYDLIGARSRGLSDDDIVNEMAPVVSEYDFDGARAGGKNAQTIISELGHGVDFGTRPDSFGDKVGRTVQKVAKALTPSPSPAPQNNPLAKFAGNQAPLTAPTPMLPSHTVNPLAKFAAPAKDTRTFQEYDRSNPIAKEQVATALDVPTTIAAIPYNLGVMGLSGVAEGFGAGDDEMRQRTLKADPSAALLPRPTEIVEGMSYEPKTEAGKKIASVVSWPFEKLAEGGAYAGAKTLEATGSPMAATAVDSAINMIPFFIPMFRDGYKSGKAAVKNSDWYRKATIPERSLVLQSFDDALRSGVKEADLAKMNPEYFRAAMRRRATGETQPGETPPSTGAGRSTPAQPSGPAATPPTQRTGTVPESIDPPDPPPNYAALDIGPEDLDYSENLPFQPNRVTFEAKLVKNKNTDKTAVLLPPETTPDQAKVAAAHFELSPINIGGKFYLYDPAQITTNKLVGHIQNGESGIPLGYGVPGIPENGVPWMVDIDGHGSLDSEEIAAASKFDQIGMSGVAPDIETAVAKIREMGRGKDADIRGLDRAAVVPVTPAVQAPPPGQAGSSLSHDIARETLTELGRISNDHFGGNHPNAVDIGTADGTFAGIGTLHIDTDGYVVLTRRANTREHLLKGGNKSASIQEMMDSSLYTGGAHTAGAIHTSALDSFAGAAYQERGVLGIFKISPKELIALAKGGKAILGNLSEGEIVLSGDIASRYLSEIHENGKVESVDNKSVPAHSPMAQKAKNLPVEVALDPEQRERSQPAAPPEAPIQEPMPGRGEDPVSEAGGDQPGPIEQEGGGLSGQEEGQGREGLLNPDVAQEPAPQPTGAAVIYARQQNAIAAFRQTLQDLAGISPEEAANVTAAYLKNKMAVMDAVAGTIRVKHGRYLDKANILKAAKNAKPVTNNASGQTDVSVEAVNELKSRNRQKIDTVIIDTRSGKERKATGIRPEEHTINDYDTMVKRYPDGTTEVIKQGRKVKRQRTPEQIAAAKRVTEASRRVDPKSDDIIVAMVKLGGLDQQAAQAEWGDMVRDSRKDLNNHVLKHTRRFGSVFKNGGMPLDKMRETLIGYGYLQEGAEIRDLEAAIQNATRGDISGSVEKSMDVEAERLAQEYLESLPGGMEPYNEILDAIEEDEPMTLSSQDEAESYLDDIMNKEEETNARGNEAKDRGNPGAAEPQAEAGDDSAGEGDVTGKIEKTDDAGGWGQSVAVKGETKAPTIGEVQKQGGKRVGTSDLLDNFTPEPAGLFDKPQFSVAKTDNPRDLIITHNLTADNLIHAAKMGGIAVPSLSVTRKGSSITGFGEITLIGSRAMADPKGYAGTKVFGADAYSPRYPEVTLVFTPKAKNDLIDKMEPWRKFTSSESIDTDALSRARQSVSTLKNNTAFQAMFLDSKGITPSQVKTNKNAEDQNQLKSDGFNKWLGEKDWQVLGRDTEFQKAVKKQYSKKYSDAGIDRELDDAGAFRVAIDVAQKISRLAYEGAGEIVDKYATRAAIEQQIKDNDLDAELEDYAQSTIAKMKPEEKIFQGFSYSGNKRYKAHTLANVVAILKKELRGGEGFNYGVGSLRAKFTPQFRSIEQIRKAKGQLLSKEDFDKVKDDVETELFAIVGELAPYSSRGKEFGFADTVINVMEDSAKMGITRALKEYQFGDVPIETKQAMAEYLEKLRHMPTEYFEAIIPREVDLSEFSGAVIPSNTSQKVRDLLNRNGLKIAEYSRGDEAGRKKAVSDFADSIDATAGNVLFSLAPQGPFYSKLSKVIEDKFPGKLDSRMASQLLSNWQKKGEFTADELEQSGLADFLAEEKRVTKQDVLDFLKAQGTEFQDVVLGADVNVELTSKEKSEFTELEELDRLGDLKDTQREKLAEYRRRAFNTIQGGGTTHFSQYTEPGAKEGSYREMFVTAPDKSNFKVVPDASGEGFNIQKPDGTFVMSADINKPAIWDSEDWARRYGFPQHVTDSWQDGHSQYSDIQNPIVRIRFNERESDGKKILFIEEIQGPSDANQQKMPDYLRKRIYDIGVKRILAYAKENGFDGVAWTPGETQVTRYEGQLRQVVDSITSYPDGDNPADIRVRARKSNNTVFNDVFVKDANGNFMSHNPHDGERRTLSDIVGKGMAAKIEAQPKSHFEGDGLTVGGHGLMDTYNVRLPALFKKYGKWEVEKTKIVTSKTGFTKLAYKGPEYTANELRSKANDLTLPSYATEHFRGLARAMDSGETFADAAEEKLSEGSAKLLGGELVEVPHTASMRGIPFIPITAQTPATYPRFAINNGGRNDKNPSSTAGRQEPMRDREGTAEDVRLDPQAIAQIELMIAQALPSGKATVSIVQEIQPPEDSEQAFAAHGKASGKIAGLHQTRRNITTGETRSLITLAMDGATKRTGLHEIEHAGEVLVMTPLDIEILAHDYPDKDGVKSSERRADAFADHVEGKEAKTSAARRIFNKVLLFIKKLKRLLTGRGWRTSEDVFDDLMSGKLKRNAQGGMDNVTQFSLTPKKIAEKFTKTVKAYKLFRVSPRKPGEIFPLFVNANQSIPLGKWVDAEAGPLTAEGKVKSKLGSLAYRPGWHAGDLPLATHIGQGGQPPTHRPSNQVWAEVELPDDVDWQEEANRRGTNKDGKLVPVKAHITDQIPGGGFYRYKTNPNMTGNWMISGSMKVNRILSDAEVSKINSDAGVADLPRIEPLDIEALGFSEDDITITSKFSLAKDKFTSADPEVQARRDAAHGLDKGPGILQRLKDFAALAVKETQHFPELDMKKDAQTADILRVFESSREAATAKTVAYLKDLTGGMKPAQMDNFEWRVLLDDLMEESGKGHSLPFGYTPETLADDHARVVEITDADETIKAALDKRQKSQQEIVKELVDKELLPGTVLENKNYFRHMVLEHANARKWAALGTKELRNKKRGWMKQREGSELDINTNFLEAEFEVYSQQLKELATKDALDKVEQINNIAPKLKRQARNTNFENLVGGPENVARIRDLEGQVADIRGDGTTLDSEDKNQLRMIYEELDELDPTRPFKKSMAIGFGKLEKLAKAGMLPEGKGKLKGIADALAYGDPTDHLLSYIAYLAAEKTEIALPARQILKAISSLDKLYRTSLGADYLEYKIRIDPRLVPEDHAEWQPEKGNIFFRETTVPDQILEKAIDATWSVEELAASGLLKESIVLGGRKKVLILPEGVAKTLDNLRLDRDSAVLDTVNKKLIGAWKIWTLLSPRRVFKYNLNNMSGDLDAALAADPKIVPYMRQAWNNALRRQKGKLTEQDKDMMDRGVMSSGISINEIPDINQLPGFKDLTADRRHQKIWAAVSKGDLSVLGPVSLVTKYFDKVSGLTNIREGLLREAAYLRALELLGKNKPVMWASNPVEIAAIPDIKDRAAKLSRELIGDYGNLSAHGEKIRARYLPFWSWMEINLPRYYRIFRNAASGKGKYSAGARIAGVAGKKFVGTSAGIVEKVILTQMLFAAVTMFNHLVWGDDDDDLDQRQLHIVVGKDSEGKVLSVRFQGAFSDALSWFGLEDYPEIYRKMKDGSMDAGELGRKIVLATPNKIVNAALPYVKLAGETIMGKTLYPDITRPRQIRDRGEHVARFLSADAEYRAATGKPSRGFADSLKGIILYTSDPKEQAYNNIRSQAMRFMEKQGKEMPGGEPTARSNALYYYKQAKRFGDKEASSKYLNQYIKIASLQGSTGEDIQKAIATSIRNASPLQATGKYTEAFINSLGAAERKQLSRAMEFYKDVYLK